MKTPNIILHALSLICIAYLFFSKPKQAQENKIDSVHPTNQESLKIAYINVDSIDKHFIMIQDLSKSIEKKQKSFEYQFQNKVKKFQEDLTKFQEQAKFLTQEQALEQQAELAQREQTILQSEQVYAEKLLKMKEENQSKLYQAVQDVIKQINDSTEFDLVLRVDQSMSSVFHASDSLDITTQVLSRLNQSYLGSKK